jgi:hypothetical protein
MTYLEALKKIEECAKYLRKEDGNIPTFRYDNIMREMREACKIVYDQAWYK